MRLTNVEQARRATSVEAAHGSCVGGRGQGGTNTTSAPVQRALSRDGTGMVLIDCRLLMEMTMMMLWLLLSTGR